MNGLNLRQEAALAIAWIHQNEGAVDFTSLGLSDAFISLKNLNMIKFTTDMSGELAFFQGMKIDGLYHYDEARKARRQFEVVGDYADALLLTLAAQATEKSTVSDVTTIAPGDSDDVSLYQELSRHGLLKVTWADNSPYVIQVTDKGRSYAEGWFQDQMDNRAQNITIAPTFNNNSAANASATIQDITLGQTIGAIVDLDIEEQVKNEAREAVCQLDSAAKCKDSSAFAEKLEIVAKIIKGSSEIAAIVLPFVIAAIKTLLG